MAEGPIVLISGIRDRKSQKFPLSTKPTGRIQVASKNSEAEIQNGAIAFWSSLKN